MEQVSSQKNRCEKFLEELKGQLPDPIHKRILEAYKTDDPVQSMETELSKILLEIISREN